MLVTDCDGMFSDLHYGLKGKKFGHSALQGPISIEIMMFRTHFSTWPPLIAQIRSSFSQSSQLCIRLSSSVRNSFCSMRLDS